MYTTYLGVLMFKLNRLCMELTSPPAVATTGVLRGVTEKSPENIVKVILFHCNINNMVVSRSHH